MKRLKIFSTLFTAALTSLSVGLMAQCPGTLVVNEISNGPDGTKEFVELIAASTDEPACGGDFDTVDVRSWIIDDNNGLFSGGAAFNGLGISQGHYRLANDPIWQNFPTGKLIVLFNFSDFDSTVVPFTIAAGNILTGGFLDTDSAIYVAVGISPLIIKFTATPVASGLGGDPNYCTSNNNQDPANNYTGMSLRNSCEGDGIQVRCPGCSPEQGLGEPSWFHGFSYGFDNDSRTNPNPNFINAAHLDFDTVGGADTLCGQMRTFFLNQGTTTDAPGVDTNWSFGLYGTVSTPGAPNSAANATFISNVSTFAVQYSACPQPTSPNVGTGVLVVTEVSNGFGGSCEYVELVVAPCGTNSQYVDIRGWILDDNNGDFSVPRGAGSGKAITSGHLRLAFNDTWDSVRTGSIIVLFNNASGQNCYNFPTDKSTIPDTINGTPVYWEPVGGSVVNNNIESAGSRPSSSNGNYCPASYTAPASSWTGRVGLSNSGDAFQVRCPGCNDVQTGEPAFYHGFGYGRATNWFTIASGTSDLGGPVFNTNSSNTRIKYVFDGSTTTPFDISNVTNWDRLAADSLGVITTAGRVAGNFIPFVGAGAFANFWPCCAEGSQASVFQGGNSDSKSSTQAKGFALGTDIVRGVYPNPTTDVLNVDLNFEGNAELRLLDINGKVILNRALTQDDLRISLDVSELPAGIYIYQVNADSGTASGKVIIE